jgi:hypothetical protein
VRAQARLCAPHMCVFLRVRVCVRARAPVTVCACVRACVRACVLALSDARCFATRLLARASTPLPAICT